MIPEDVSASASIKEEPSTTIICPVDFSEASYNSVQFSLALCQMMTARLVVLHVYESPVHFTTARFARAEDIRLYREASEHMEAFVERLTRMPAISKVKVEGQLKSGVPSATTLEVAENGSAELIVMAASSADQVERVILGSNASRIVLHARTKVLVVPRGLIFSVPREIIYACDLTAENQAAVHLLLPFLNLFGARLKILYVQTEKTAEDEEALQTFVSQLKAAGDLPSGVEALHLCDSDPAKAIREYLQHAGQCWFALYHRHRSWFAGIRNPSLAKEISSDPGVPVLVLNEGAAAVPQYPG